MWKTRMDQEEAAPMGLPLTIQIADQEESQLPML